MNAPLPHSAHAIALSELDAAPDPSGAPLLDTGSNPLHHIKARLQVCVGEATITVGELMAAKAHHVVKLDRGVEQPVDILLEGRVVARGQLVAVDDQFGVRITELPVPLKP